MLADDLDKLISIAKASEERYVKNMVACKEDLSGNGTQRFSYFHGRAEEAKWWAAKFKSMKPRSKKGGSSLKSPLIEYREHLGSPMLEEE